jgi:hypothetical protein
MCFFFTFLCAYSSCRAFYCCHGMFVVCIHLLEIFVYHCRLLYHSYLGEVGGDGSVLGGWSPRSLLSRREPHPRESFSSGVVWLALS